MILLALGSINWFQTGPSQCPLIDEKRRLTSMEIRRAKSQTMPFFLATKNSKKANDFLSFSGIHHWNDENLQSLAVGEVNEICTR
jgi:hypothetical protein